MTSGTCRDWALALNRRPEASPSDPARTLVVVAPRGALPIRSHCHHIFREPIARGTGLAAYVGLAMIRRLAADAVVTITTTPDLGDPIAAVRAVAAQLPDTVVARADAAVVVGSIEALWALGRVAQPALLAHLDALVPLIGGRDEASAIKIIYRSFAAIDLAHGVLARAPERVTLVAADPARSERSAA